MGNFNYAAFFLLGVDSLIACIVTGPMFIRPRPHEHRELRSPDEHKHAARWKWWAIVGLGLSALTVPYGISYGVGDGLGYLLGTLFHFSTALQICPPASAPAPPEEATTYSGDVHHGLRPTAA